MHRLTDWFIDNPVAANLMMVLVLLAGFLAVTSLRIEGFPQIPADTVVVSTGYPGASAAQVDVGVSQKIEQALEGLPGVRKIQSLSLDDYSVVQIQKAQGADLDRLLAAVKTRMDALEELPTQTQRPVVERADFDFPALIVQVYGQTDPDVLQRVAGEVRRELLALPEVSRIKTWGLRKFEISIEADPDKLQGMGLSLPQLAEAIGQHSLVYRTGSLRTEGGRIQVRADRQALNFADFFEMPVTELADGTRILLRDVATIRDTLQEEESTVRYQGQPGVGMEIVISQRDNLLEVSAAVHALTDRLQAQLPQGLTVDIWADQSSYISDRLELLRTNAFQGLLLVLILLALFLNVKLAFWVAMGIPVSLAGTLWVMGWDSLGYSLNDITTFGMIIVLGILVDDAVVVGESVDEQRALQADPVQATKTGVARVATATVFGVLTTIAAFFPMLLLDNPLGKVLAGFASVVIIALIFSLLESKFLLPAHLAHSRPTPVSTLALSRLWTRLQQGCQQGLQTVIDRLYRPVIAWSLQYRYAVIILFVAIWVMAVGLVNQGVVRTTFFPDVPGSIISVQVSMDTRSPYSLTLRNALAIEAAARQVNDEWLAQFAADSRQVGPIRRVMTAAMDPETIEIYAELVPEHQRTLDTLSVLDRWRERVGQLEGVVNMDFSGSVEMGGGFALELVARDENVLAQGTQKLTEALAALPGVRDVQHNLKGGQPELFLTLRPEARRMGLSTEALAMQVGDGYGALEVQRLQRRGEEVKVLIRFAEERRDAISDLFESRIQTPDGHWVPLLAVATIESRYVPKAVTRRDGKRAVLVTANLDKRIAAPAEVFAQLQAGVIPSLRDTWPELAIAGAGELEQEGELRGGLIKALVLTLVLIYVLLAIPLKSYWQPLVIMSVIPFGFAGAVFGHWLLGIPLSLLSFFGLLALAGIIVNDSLVMMTRYNDLCAAGEPPAGALAEAGCSRFRAIFLTTVTTVAGMAPLLMETSEQAQYLIPAAVSLVFGELFGTAITLVCVPVLILVFRDVGLKGADEGMKAVTTLRESDEKMTNM